MNICIYIYTYTCMYMYMYIYSPKLASLQVLELIVNFKPTHNGQLSAQEFDSEGNWQRTQQRGTATGTKRWGLDMSHGLNSLKGVI